MAVQYLLVILWVLWLVNSALTAQWAEIFYPFGCGDLTRTCTL